MARYVFTAARRRALKKAQRASRAKRRGHKARRPARAHKRRAHSRVRRTHGRRKYVFTAARRRALKKAQMANRHHSRIGRKGARIRRFKSELAGLGYGEYAVNPRRKTRRSRVTPGGAAARLAKWRWHHNPDVLAGGAGMFNPAVLAGGAGMFNPAVLAGGAGMFNPFRKGKVRSTKRRIGKVFKRKGRFYIVTRLRNGVKVARPWSKRSRR